ncbi:DUF1553 domain-containing protein [Flavihumibacter fluvii]|uniref:DUF1553 domain-containing protein n=1 Tax=Flavihumibacter fluvii TaxID=2838157 RepID=UPI001BDEF18C|nr:DUF1553 domain-containing protein [Flavihumibacter fluvii]ULQ54182.1 DUF1549 domain-containing protein [Flavihumibacter fluvii]
MSGGNFFNNQRKWLVLALLVAAVGVFIFFNQEKQVDYSAEIKPILNKKCITCHGGVKAKAGFSVLFREEALAATESGKPAIIPGDADGSELMRRITHNDPEERMPYKHEPLTKDEINLFRNWINQGAKWGDHWAYLPVKEISVPAVNDSWVKNDIDNFILQKLQEKLMKPSAKADKATLLRRVSLDLIGLYPSEKLVQEYLQSNDSSAYEKLVDSLLVSPQFGERWASMWLDLARYADTKGYEADNGRDIWPYRDWVIRAFNDNMPYDRFIKEQIAGDLLPEPTDEDYIATAFHRNTMTNDEGGTNNEEFRTSAVVDRVNTTWEALMGTTFSCVQCHSHPYDPFRHDEYYKFLAYFNDTRDEDVPGEFPLLRQFPDSMQKELDGLIDWVMKNAGDDDAKRVKHFLRTYQPAQNSTNADSIQKGTIYGNNADLGLMKNGSARLRQVNLQNSNQLVWHYNSNRKGGVVKFRLDKRDGPVIATTNIKASDQSRYDAVSYPVQSGIHDIFIEYENPSITKGLEDFALSFDWISFNREFPGKGQPGYDSQQKRYWRLLTANIPGTPILLQNPDHLHRTTQVFERGNWRTKGKKVGPAVPASLSFAMPVNAPKNRIGLVQWLTDPRHPLVSRTMVNRLWEQLFGTGIVETLEDMGTQGITPTHQELLDYLAYTFMHTDKWDMKKMLKRIVMSATYQQDSKLTEEDKRKDLFNKWYARGPRVRLSAEQIRDQALSISGALSAKMYGPGVMPWQPEGIWLSPYNGARWENSKGEEQYRRSVYTYLKRTALYPSMISFDGAQRVVCSARRIRTNTPLQALVTLNDSAYIDLAGHFARRMLAVHEQQVEQKIAKGYELLLFKPIPPARLPIFVKLYNQALDEYKGRKDSAAAAMFVVANAMMNLDEVVTKN